MSLHLIAYTPAPVTPMLRVSTQSAKEALKAKLKADPSFR